MKIKLARHIWTKKIIHIDNAENGLLCNCVCEKCGEKLEACQGKIRVWHFRHWCNLNCNGSEETALHKLAKQIILENRKLIVSSETNLDYWKAESEPVIGNYRADVAVDSAEGKVYFEIVVRNPLSSEKEMFYKSSEIKCVEIDLSSLCETNYSYNQLREIVLNTTRNKRIVFWEKEATPEILPPVAVEQEAEQQNQGISLLAVLLILFLGAILFSGNRRRL